ncbi:MAG TPA: hypothetical protein VM534_06820 [Thermoanaerobaculia bacterium]|nr:hypothetical protein [Thermoanaerobaculia bacterium]
MNFSVRRSIGANTIRFGVDLRRLHDEVETAEIWSTDEAGHYLPRSSSPLYFTEETQGPGVEPEARYRDSVFRGGSRAPVSTFAAVGAGIFLIIIGMLVVVRKGGAAGWVEMFLGVLVIVAPWILSAKRRRDERDQAERQRKAREEEEALRGERIGEYARSLESLSAEVSTSELEALRRAREQREIEYESFSPLAKQAIFRIAMAGLVGSKPPAAVRGRLEEIGAAIGLTGDDLRGVLLHLYQKVVWHLVADHRIDGGQRRRVEQIREAFGLAAVEIEKETAALDQLRALQQIGPKRMPEASSAVSLGFRERLHHVSPAILANGGERLSPLGRILRGSSQKSEGELLVTSSRLRFEGPSGFSIPLDQIFELEVDVDRNRIVAVRGGEHAGIYQFVLADPIYTAGLIRAAAAVPKKPAGLL